MKTRLVPLLALALTACTTPVQKAERVDKIQNEIRSEESVRIDQAAGAVAATGKLLAQDPPAVEAAKETNAAAAAALPKPKAETAKAWGQVAEDLLKGQKASLDRALELIAASETKQAELATKLETARIELNKSLELQAAADRDRATQAESQKNIVEKQTLGLTAAGVLMLLIGTFALYKTHVMLASVLGGLGVLLILLGRITATVPDWVWSVLFGVGVIGIPVALWIGYGRGLFQKPPTQIGEYAVTH
jgi:hypothetical protein